MITVIPNAEYDCVYVELIDEVSRVRVHLHKLPERFEVQPELRQIIVDSKAETVFAADRVTREDRLLCDPHSIGGLNDYPENENSKRDSGSQSDEIGKPESQVTDVSDEGD